MRRLALLLPLSLFPLLLASPSLSAPPEAKEVTRYREGYRYSQDGWIVLHVEGEPYARGYQQGRLLAKEIAAYIRMLATECSPRSPADGWKDTRQLANLLFLRKIDREVLEEMKGIADGATDAGASYNKRDIDLLDIVVLNAWMEITCIESALETMPNGLEDTIFPRPGLPRAPAPRAKKTDRCSAFIATEPATADGKN